MRFPLAASFALSLVLLLAGCGGGGGGGGNNGGPTALTYATTWSQGNGLQGQSQLVTLRDLGGNVLETRVLNRNSGATSVTFGVVSAGAYQLDVSLYSMPDATGSKVGIAAAELNLNGATSYETVVGVSPSGITVTPSTATFTVQQTKAFLAAGSVGGKATFLNPNALQWTALGGVATVNSNGLASGIAPGNGSIRATDTLLGASGAAAIAITPFQTQHGKWTVLVFLNAANDLFQFSDLNVNQMEKVAQNPDVRFVLQWKQTQGLFPTSSFNGTRRYLVQPDTTNQIQSDLVQDMGTEIDMGLPQTLKEFIDWGKTFYPAERYVLVVWNHGNGWRRSQEDIGRAVSYDDETGSAIQIWQLKQALGTSQFDIVAWDASLMQMAEVAYELKDNTPYVAGSEESPPGEGYPYDRIFAKFRDTPDEATKLLSKSFVDGMLAVPEYASRKITQSVVETAKLPALATAVSNLTTSLIANQSSLQQQVQTARNTAQSYSLRSNRIYVDIRDVFQILKTQASVPAGVVTDCTAVQNAAASAIVWEGHNANSPKSTGLSIDFSSASAFAGAGLEYGLLQFAQSSQWGNWLTVAP